jgi:molybdopterin-guanine dinucleotide biosynthesis adapter protein
MTNIANSTPTVAIVGRSKTGKTTLIEKLIRELNNRNYRIATVKNTLHKADFDVPGKDTWRHMQAGSQATALSSADSIMIIKKKTGSDDLGQIFRFYDNDYDLIIVEGYKESDLPKIEVHRKEKGLPLTNLTELLAIATDEKLDSDVLQISLDDYKGIADIIQKKVIEQKANK